MTTVRGKYPVKLVHVIEVTNHASLDHAVTIKVCGNDSTGNLFTAEGQLSVWCTVSLIKQLRRALRENRDRINQMSNQSVSDAEGPLS